MTLNFFILKLKIYLNFVFLRIIPLLWRAFAFTNLYFLIKYISLLFQCILMILTSTNSNSECMPASFCLKHLLYEDDVFDLGAGSWRSRAERNNHHLGLKTSISLHCKILIVQKAEEICKGKQKKYILKVNLKYCFTYSMTGILGTLA